MPREFGIVDGVKALSKAGSTSPTLYGTNNNSPLHGRVVNISLSPNDDLFKKYNSLEAIEFEPIHDRSIVDESGDKTKNYLVAYKLHSGVRTPLINEIVPLISAPNIFVQTLNNQFSQVFYYDDPISIYSAIEHNAAPDENTIQNLNNFNSSNNKVSTYQSSTSGITNNTPGTDTILSKTDVKLGEYFVERGIKPLMPLEGDHKIEGRFGNSIRMSGTPSSDVSKNLSWKGSNIGSPVVIIRNNQQKIDSGSNTDALFEDINQDGSSFYFLSDQTIELVLASNNFDSYNQSNDNSTVRSNIIVSNQKNQPITSSLSQNDISSPLQDNDPLPVSQSVLQGSSKTSHSDLDFVPDNEDDLDFVQVGEDIPVPLTQGTILNKFNNNYKFTEAVNASSMTNASNLVKAPVVSLSTVNAINNFAGQVSNVPTITKNGKALLDLIAITEGTIGQGKFNGYDIMVTGKLIPGFDMANSAPVHPNIAIPTEYKPSTASGRYQFVINTWNLVAGKGAPMSKVNQDYACWKNILNSANVPSVLINKIDSDLDSFKQVINMLASQWSSLPTIKDPKGLYKQAGRFSMDILYTYYKQILSKYK